mgnify:CR=1 FL=1
MAVNPLPDPAAGNQPDVDGSERLVRFIIDGVPDGVTVQGGVYIGDTPGNPNTARWLVDVDPDAVIDGTVTQTLVFNLDGTADELANLNQAITITAVNDNPDALNDTATVAEDSGAGRESRSRGRGCMNPAFSSQPHGVFGLRRQRG